MINEYAGFVFIVLAIIWALWISHRNSEIEAENHALKRSLREANERERDREQKDELLPTVFNPDVVTEWHDNWK